jgi:hypothetical protein
MAIQLLGTNQLIPLTVKFTTLAGSPSSVEGAPTWASSDESILTLDVAADGMSATAIAVGVVGSATVTVTADSDLTDEVKQISGSQDFSVIEPTELAAVVTIVPGTPENKPQIVTQAQVARAPQANKGRAVNSQTSGYAGQK